MCECVGTGVSACNLPETSGLSPQRDPRKHKAEGHHTAGIRHTRAAGEAHTHTRHAHDKRVLIFAGADASADGAVTHHHHEHIHTEFWSSVQDSTSLLLPAPLQPCSPSLFGPSAFLITEINEKRCWPSFCRYPPATNKYQRRRAAYLRGFESAKNIWRRW